MPGQTLQMEELAAKAKDPTSVSVPHTVERESPLCLKSHFLASTNVTYPWLNLGRDHEISGGAALMTLGSICLGSSLM